MSTHPPENDSDTKPSEAPRADSDPSLGIYAPPRRRAARPSQREESKPGLWNRMTGRHRLEEIREQRYHSYTYESNEQNLKWTTMLMAGWIIILLWLAWVDLSNSQTYQQWLDRGIESIAPNQEYWSHIESPRIFAQENGGDAMACAYLFGRDISDECPDGELPADAIQAFIDENELRCTHLKDDSQECAGVWTSREFIKFANAEGFNCSDAEATFTFFHEDQSLYPDCGEVLDIASELQASQDRSRLIWMLLMLILLVTAFPYLSTIHRASRNLLPLKSKDQKHRPEWAVLHHFIPILNLFRPLGVISELFKGSDPEVSIEDESAWKSKGRVHTFAYIWYGLWAACILFNPITIPRWFGRGDMEEILAVSNYFVYADLLLIALGVAGLLMLRQLHILQEARFAKIGPITVTPPLPIDPLQEMLAQQEEDERKRKRGGKR